MPLLFQTLRQQTAGTLRLLYGIDESQLAGYPGVSSSKLFFFLCHVSKHWSTFTVYVTANYLGLDTSFRVYIYIYMDKKYYCTFSISSKAAIYSRRLVHIITERIYIRRFFVQRMHIFLHIFFVIRSSSFYQSQCFLIFFVRFLASKSLFSYYNDRSKFNYIR